MKEVVFYRMVSGRCPVEEFLDSLESKQAQKVTWVLRLVEEIDLVPAQYPKKLVGSEDIWEVRVQVAGNIFRVLGFLDGAELVVLNHAFQKKTPKIPP
ncbi:MAG: type II toxin-antitoxin system RelE/ParE family toxin [Nitrosospira sp.]|nr:type II toxin-antitoxin system RelE/ParE family toxin [Nitrosospira sp.]